MKIGILGAGNIGGNLGRRWAAAGHQIRFGVREPGSSKVQALLTELGGKASAGTLDQASSFGEVVILSVPWGAASETLRQAGKLAGKILIDCTNPVAPGPSLALGFSTSGAEEVARMAPGARVVKAFNSLGAEHILNPAASGQQASTFLCGDDAQARALVAQLGQDIGFDVVDCGALASARLIEPLAMLWIRLAMVQGMGRQIAFKLIHA